MAQIPQAVRESEISGRMRRAGFTRVHQGKVRDTYAHPTSPDQLVVVATDRLSIFDFVLPVLVPRKGEVLTALTHHWLRHAPLVPPGSHHLTVSQELAGEFPGMPAERVSMVRRLEMLPFEMIFRGHIGGSVWTRYQETSVVAGKTLPSGLTKWQKLERPIFTPSTKADVGHDVNITVEEFLDQAGEAALAAVQMLEEAYLAAYERAREAGILILDTKFEVGRNGSGDWVIGDEVLTPDSSRFTTVEDFEEALNEGRDPMFYDKETVRNWGRTVETPWGMGLNALKPENSEHLAFVAALEVPPEVVEDTTSRYQDIFWRLTGMPLERYQREVMGV